MSIGLYVGADIASTSIQVAWLDVNTHRQEEMVVQHKRSDYRRLVKRLTRDVPAEQVQVVM